MKLNIFIMCAILSLSSVNTVAAETVNTFAYEQVHLNNLVRAQYHRWFQLFEREVNDARLQNHLALLSDDVHIRHYGGSMTGHQGMIGFINAVKTWQNAHHVENMTVTGTDIGVLNMEADIVYQNIQPGGAQSRNRLHYQTRLNWEPGQLPIFSDIVLLPTAGLATETFIDAFPENRAYAFAYYWLALSDGSLTENDPWTQVVTPESEFLWNGASVEDLTEWRAATQPSADTTWHQLNNLSFKVLDQGNMTIEADVTRVQHWEGKPDESSKFLLQWQVRYNGDEPYAQLIRVDIHEQ